MYEGARKKAKRKMSYTEIIAIVVMGCMLLYVLYEAVQGYIEERKLKRIVNERRSGGTQWKL